MNLQMSEKNLTVLQWNAHSLYNKLEDFKVKLYKYAPHLACICETWLKSNREPNFSNYDKYLCNRTTHNGGGIAILVRKDLINSPMNLNHYHNGMLEIQAITIKSFNKSLQIINLYNPNRDVSSEEFNHYFSQL